MSSSHRKREHVPAASLLTFLFTILELVTLQILFSALLLWVVAAFHISAPLFIFALFCPLGFELFTNGYVPFLEDQLLEVVFALLWWRLVGALGYCFRKLRRTQCGRGYPPFSPSPSPSLPQPQLQPQLQTHIVVSYPRHTLIFKWWFKFLALLVAPLEYNRALWNHFLWRALPNMSSWTWTYAVPPPPGEEQLNSSRQIFSETFALPVKRPVKLVSAQSSNALHPFPLALACNCQSSLSYAVSCLPFSSAGRNRRLQTCNPRGSKSLADPD